jgi:hypothetical protein
MSLVTRDELDLLDELDLDAADLAEVLAVKAIFAGTIVGEAAL